MKALFTLLVVCVSISALAQSDSTEANPLDCYELSSNDSSIRDSMSVKEVLRMDHLYVEFCSAKYEGKIPIENYRFYINIAGEVPAMILVKNNKIDQASKSAFASLKSGNQIVIQNMSAQVEGELKTLPSHVIVIID